MAVQLGRIESSLAVLPQGLREHIQRVRATALEFATAWELSPENRAAVDLAAAAHDLARHLPPEALLAEAKRLRIPVTLADRHAPILLHGPVAAELLVREHGVTDTRVVNAARFHTTGRPNMDAIAQAVFLADKVEPWKLQRRPRLAPILALAFTNPKRAIADFLTDEITALFSIGGLVHPMSIETRNSYIVASGRPLPPHPGA
jgi:predicted HD superfamily hydrolase involved in NAD metabolism